LEHELKAWPEYFQAVRRGDKPFEIRNEDGRRFEVGDVLLLREWEPMTTWYTGAAIRVLVTYVLRGGPWLPTGYAAMGVRLATFEEGDPTFVCEECGRDTHMRVNGICLTCATEELTP
jgi:hypothetical protein